MTETMLSPVRRCLAARAFMATMVQSELEDTGACTCGSIWPRQILDAKTLGDGVVLQGPCCYGPSYTLPD